MLGDSAASEESLRRLGELGVDLAIDDFATGFSALDYVKRLSVRSLKIDRSFVTGLGEDAEDAAIVAAVINMAHALNILTIADGVETREQVDHLKSLGCDVGQGQFFARPRPSEAIAELLGAVA
jgi:EAL domain-containing protein (putative c-di-GMP-specific phosphodiesterase class I)